MSRATLARLILSAVVLLTPHALLAEDQGQAELDKAVELQLTAQTADDFEEVAKQCEQAIQKGLGAENRGFAERLLSSTLFQRAGVLAAEVLAQPAPDDENWQATRKSAIASLEKAFQYNRKMPEGYLLLARLEMVPGADNSRSLDAIDKALTLLEGEPKKLAEALLIRATLAQDPGQRLADLDRAVEVDPENASAWEMRALHYQSVGEFANAIADLEKLLEIAPDNLEVRERMAKAYFGLKQPEKGLEQLDKIIELRPDLPQGHLLRAQYHLTTKQPVEALKDLDAAVEVAPRQPRLLMMRAEVRRLQNQLTEAMEDIERILELVPGAVSGIHLRSRVLADQGKVSEALADLMLLVKEQPDALEFRLDLIQLLMRDDRPRRAIEECSAALEKAENHPLFLSLRATAYISVGKHSEAIEDYEAALPQDPENQHMLNNFAWLLATSTDDALRDGRRALELAKQGCEVTQFEAAHILSTYAAAFAELGDWENATKWSAESVAKNERDVEKAETEADKKRAQEQLDHLKKELESYQQQKPWREKQETPENMAPIREAGVDLET